MERKIQTLDEYVKIHEELQTNEIDPSKFNNPDAKNGDFFLKGKKDGSLTDDVVHTKETSIPAKSLKPSQDAVYLGKALGLAINGVVGGNLDAVISKDDRILDGHHRWAATIFNNPDAKVTGAKADLKIGDLVPVLRQAGDAMGNNRGLPPDGGDVNIFDATINDVIDCVYNGKNMDPKYFNKEKSIKWFEELGKDLIEKRLKMIQKYPAPAGAPPRSEMPKIEPNQVKKVATDLNGGKIDVRKPYMENENTIFDDFFIGRY